MKRLLVAGLLTAALVAPVTPTVAHADINRTVGSCAPTNWGAYRASGTWTPQGVLLAGRSTTRGRNVTTTIAVLGVGTLRRVTGPTWLPVRRKLTSAPLALVTIKMSFGGTRSCSFRLRRAT